MSLRPALLAASRAAAAPRAAPRFALALPTLARASPRRTLATTAPRRDEALVEAVMETARRNVAAGVRSPQASEHEKGLRILMFGKPGSGKGTLSGRLVATYDIAFISTGDLLRQEIASKSEIGREAEAIVASGGLVSDDLMLRMVLSELEHHHGQSWIIDGFPRTLQQGEMLNKVLQEQGRPFNMVVNLNVPDSGIMERIAARWVHLPSGRVYNDSYSAPKQAGIDDVTGEPLSKRPDDTPEVFSKRLQSYYKSTAPLLEFFAAQYPDALHSLTGNTSDQLWPLLQGLVVPSGLESRFDHVRKQADDLRDSGDIEVDGKVAHVQ